jgi:ketosteroid isomerase-like protein
MKGLLACFAAASLAGCVTPESSPTSSPSFQAALEMHLAAVSARNMDALLPTLTSGDKLTMIAPNGFKWDTKRQYIDFHRQWFASKDDGQLKFETIRVIESPALAHALIRYRYKFKDNAGNAQSSVNWLTLTFALENGAWRLVFDQNTLLTDQPTQ